MKESVSRRLMEFHVWIQCQKCRQYFKSKCMLKKHPCESFECDKCGLQLKRKKDLKIHLKTHQVANIECDLCDVKCTTVEAMRAHVNFTHKTARRCQLCQKAFKSTRQLEIHSQTHNKKFACPFCQKGFKSTRFMQIHIKNRHENPQIFACLICAKEFPSKNYLRTHQRSHAAYCHVSKFMCGICQYATYHKENLEKHEAWHVRKEKDKDLKKNWIKCDLCPAKLKNRLKLSSHKWKYHKLDFYSKN